MEYISVNGKEYGVLKLLGKGKGGYSYLVCDEAQNRYVLKQIHHEPCEYYQFGDKLQSELRDYQRLKEIGIPIPELLDADVQGERILKTYIDGPTVAQLVQHNSQCRHRICQSASLCKGNSLCSYHQNLHNFFSH